ncbi:MAG: hypothetical protein M3462_09735, partial [Chloroflexota bacterium]|nr:hypothetical protein [Chloroflexota bacterium]
MSPGSSHPGGRTARRGRDGPGPVCVPLLARIPAAVVLPGFAESIDLLGYLIERCPDCLQR